MDDIRDSGGAVAAWFAWRHRRQPHSSSIGACGDRTGGQFTDWQKNHTLAADGDVLQKLAG